MQQRDEQQRDMQQRDVKSENVLKVRKKYLESLEPNLNP